MALEKSIGLETTSMLLVEEKRVDRQSLQEIEELWRGLESHSGEYFFTSWHWIGAWLRTSATDPRLLMVYDGNSLVGMGCVHFSQFNKNAFAWKQANLNRTGNSGYDQIWIEYNDVLAAPDIRAEVRESLIHHVLGYSDIAEFRIGMSLNTVLDSLTGVDTVSEYEFRTKGFLLNLRPEFSDFNTLLKAFSSNTRSQIRRSYKAYSSHGELTVTSAGSREEALDYFAAAGHLHKEKWSDSGFHNSKFINFHKDLINNSFDEGVIDLLKVSAGETVLAYLYNFVYRGRVYFYLSGINYEPSDNQYKPGLLAHVLAISWYSARNMAVYDFMAGDARYKRSLSDSEYDMALLSIKKKTIKTSAYKLLKKVRTQVKRGLNKH
ncbi:hypothetical protein BTA51_10485 [Hahella sp. CCB-MM4]|uniref:GNAT family N-acetyltransferase n=1 Tax=Hahella sp. (strain CCB-MM4) TaxID=1926491 RepID=UPI000B9AA0EB|nr:GNAT family N-acetyltransferase [Hahella sp. CCB-MM4]OZG73438.1 hypothetical protein BTA51_10485 [Hahella sp. CCB-MM4]